MQQNKNIVAVYKILNKINGKFYIGSSVNFKNRKAKHLNLLRNGTSSAHLQNAWNKHKEENFVFIVLEEVMDIENLIKREQFYIDTLKPSYNMRKAAGCGLKTEEEKIRMQEAAAKDRHAVTQYTLDDIKIKNFVSINEAARKLNIPRERISKCCVGKAFSTCGFRFSYLHKELYFNSRRARYSSNEERNEGRRDSNSNTYLVWKEKESKEAVKKVTNLKTFCTENGVTYSSACRAARQSKQKQVNGYIFKVIKKNKRGNFWPSDKKFKKMLIGNTLEKVGKELGCSSSNVRLHAISLGVWK